jgi:hypothetical protein
MAKKIKRRYHPSTGADHVYFSVNARKSTLRAIDAAVRAAGVSRSYWIVQQLERLLKIK